EALVGIARRPEARELAHGPGAGAIHGRLRAPRIGVLAGEADVPQEVLVGAVRRGEDVRDRNPRVGHEFLAPQGHALEGGGEHLLLPLLLRLPDAPDGAGVVGGMLGRPLFARRGDLGGRLAHRLDLNEGVRERSPPAGSRSYPRKWW